jgi:hypothetical protein
LSPPLRLPLLPAAPGVGFSVISIPSPAGARGAAGR